MVAIAIRRHRCSATDPGPRPIRPPLRIRAKAHINLRLFAVRDHQCLRQPVDPREREPLHEPPRGKKSGPGIRRSCGNKQWQRHRKSEWHCGQPGPEPVPRPGHGLAKIVATGRLRHLPDGRLAERPRPLLFALIANDLHDAEQLVAQRRKAAGDQPRQPVEPALAPDPAVEGDGDRGAAGDGRGEEHPPHRSGRVADAVEQKQDKPGHEHAEEGAADGLDRLDHPDSAPKGTQLLPQALGQRKAAGTHVRRRHVAAHMSPRVMITTHFIIRPFKSVPAIFFPPKTIPTGSPASQAPPGGPRA